MICSSIILVFAVINLSVGPFINSRVKNWPWSLKNCGKISDELDKLRTQNPSINAIKSKERELSECRHKKSMNTLEVISFVLNIFTGFICFLSGFFGLEKELKKKMGIVGMLLGVIGFVLTLVYVIYNGIVMTNYYDLDYYDESKCYKVDGDSAFAELDGNKYECFYFNEKDDEIALHAKYSDLIKSQYNYNKGLRDDYKNKYSELYNCRYSPSLCLENGYIDGPITFRDLSGRICQKLYYYNSYDDNSNFDQGCRFYVSLFLSILTLLCYCGLVFCGFLLFKEP